MRAALEIIHAVAWPATFVAIALIIKHELNKKKPM
jgi:hypothetical protein